MNNFQNKTTRGIAIRTWICFSLWLSSTIASIIIYDANEFLLYSLQIMFLYLSMTGLIEIERLNAHKRIV